MKTISSNDALYRVTPSHDFHVVHAGPLSLVCGRIRFFRAILLAAFLRWTQYRLDWRLREEAYTQQWAIIWAVNDDDSENLWSILLL